MDNRRRNDSGWERRQQAEDASDTAAIEREKLEQSQKQPD
jgi:hypothetical protein